MTLCDLHIGAFAGLEDYHIKFNDDLTLIYGPNEAGKSTVFYAVLHTLLTSVDLTPAQLKKTMGRFVPLGTGKHMQTSLTIQLQEKYYRINKRWPGQLELLDLSDNRCIGRTQQNIDDLLPLQPATIRHVALQTQQETTAILEHLSEKKAVAQNLSDFLRATIFTPVPGFSLEKFQEQLFQRIKQQCNHWDEDADQPENRRDYRTPWKKEPGAILKRYYDWQRLDAAHREFIRLEENLDVQGQDLRSLTLELKEKTEQAQTLQKQLTLLLKKEKEHSDYEKREKELVRLKKLRLSWPELLKQIDDLHKKIVSGEKNLEELDKEHTRSLKKAEIPQLRSHLHDEKKKQQTLQKLEQEYQALRVPSDELIAQAAELHEQSRHLRLKMEKGRIKVHLTAKSPLDVEFSHALSDAEKVSLASKESVQKEELSFLVVDTEQLSIRVEEDTLDVSQLVKELTHKETQLSRLLGQYECENVVEAHERQRQGRLLQDQIQALQREGRGSIADISQNLQLLESLPARDVSEVAAEQGHVRATLQHDRQTLAQSKEENAALGRELLSVENLNLRIDQLITQTPSVRTKKGGEETEDTGEMEQTLRSLHHALESLRTRQQEAIASYARMEEQFQALAREHHSRDDLQRKVDEARNEFEREKKIAQSLHIIQQETLHITQESEESELRVYQKEFIDLLAELGNRFQLTFNGISPSLSQSGEFLHFRWLSEGMQDIFALISRLLSAKFLFKGGGFMLLDDPLVNLDAERSQMALEIIQKFSLIYQTVFFTCHTEPLRLSDDFVELFGRVGEKEYFSAK